VNGLVDLVLYLMLCHLANISIRQVVQNASARSKQLCNGTIDWSAQWGVDMAGRGVDLESGKVGGPAGHDVVGQGVLGFCHLLQPVFLLDVHLPCLLVLLSQPLLLLLEVHLIHLQLDDQTIPRQPGGKPEWQPGILDGCCRLVHQPTNWMSTVADTRQGQKLRRIEGGGDGGVP